MPRKCFREHRHPTVPCPHTFSPLKKGARGARSQLHALRPTGSGRVETGLLASARRTLGCRSPLCPERGAVSAGAALQTLPTQLSQALFPSFGEGCPELLWGLSSPPPSSSSSGLGSPSQCSKAQLAGKPQVERPMGSTRKIGSKNGGTQCSGEGAGRPGVGHTRGKVCAQGGAGSHGLGLCMWVSVPGADVGVASGFCPHLCTTASLRKGPCLPVCAGRVRPAR